MPAQFTFNAETRTTTCRACSVSEIDTATEEEAKIWRATHLRHCRPPAATNQTAKILPLRPR
ncbi:hypothetical protein ACFXPX_04425 [Kitasatospora sp. NPDC059146]|uniref:hypothetical protein n=1 Tax=unclassified Kitasatospora TaxID=2633591 RepID=UPI003692D2A3